MAKTVITKNVEDLAVDDIATFKQSGKVARFTRWLHEKVTAVIPAESGEYVQVQTVDKVGNEDVYNIPTGTQMRVHVKSE